MLIITVLGSFLAIILSGLVLQHEFNSGHSKPQVSEKGNNHDI